MKKLISLFFAFLFVLNMTTPCFAFENADVLTNYDGNSARAGSIPTATTILPYTAKIVDLSEAGYTYTAKKFKPTGTDIYISGYVKACTAELNKYRICTIELYESGVSSPVRVFSTNAFFTRTDIDTTFTGLNSSKYYYMVLRNSVYDTSDGQRAIEGSLTLS